MTYRDGDQVRVVTLSPASELLLSVRLDPNSSCRYAWSGETS
ncbi:hypothetical protein AB0I10_34760 [Streptomyces sp. NPDC050636]